VRFYSSPPGGTLPLWKTEPTNGTWSIELPEAQIEIFGMFNDLRFENPDLTFEEVVQKEFGPDLFPPTPQGRLFEK
jgi:hypothetical protein